jgi:3-isopropylmalate/(R)-2-methylmalate dehydratase large subunit
MAKTIAEKVFARTSGKGDVKPGNYLSAKIDLHYNLEDGLAEVQKNIIGAGLPSGLRKLANPDALALMIGDHQGCHAKPEDARAYKIAREFAQKYRISKVYDIDLGIAHVTVPEEGLARPGMLICGKDSHSTTCGAVNALSIPVSAVETAWIYATGELWFRVPETIKFVCNGKLPDIDAMGMDGRFTLACQSIELGAKCVPFEPDETCLEYVKATPRHSEPFWPTPADKDAVYEKTYIEDFSFLEPQVAVPHGFSVVKPVREVEGVKIDQCSMGSCASARYDDLEIIARIVKGKKVKTRTIFSPGSWKIYRKALKSGILETLVDAGIMVMAPSCLPCDGRGACIADGETAIATTTRNFRGRFGSKDSKIYLASSATAAASALTGKITDPRMFL